MKQESFRIIHQETGKVRFVGKQLFNDIDSLKQMGYIQQDLGQSDDEELEETQGVNPTSNPVEAKDIFDPLQIGDKMPDPLATPGEDQEEEVVVKRKPGRQPKAV